MSCMDLEELEGEEFSLGEEDADLDDLIDDEVANSPHHNKHDEEFNPDDIRTQEAALLTQNELNEAMEQRGLKFQGFFTDDARTLQRAFDEERAEFVEAERRKFMDKKARAQKQERMQRKRLLHEQQLKEEHDEVENDPRVKAWLDMIHKDVTNSSARIAVNSITARVLAQALWDNQSLVCLDLSRNNLDDYAGLRLGRMLKRNTALKKLELDSNNLAVKTCNAMAESLATNTTLTLLSLESNPLTKNGKDVSGIMKLGDMLKVNKTLTSFNAWRSDIGAEGGAVIARAMANNTTMVFLDMGNNKVSVDDMRDIAAMLQRNQNLALDNQAAATAEADRQAVIESDRKAQADKVQKKEDFASWMEEQKEERADQRRKELEELRVRREEEQQKLDEEMRIQREKKAAEEANAGKKKKKKGKKKK
mmetsp:Transcript_12706/g.29848  ORF Transcript_12706/g.29848 Transcript_12706/m.29848 type:complete len:422 (-) Transcript_12706:158-1423(-)|eukprot:CAMPEP_0182572012 /NCGR_PEP_ID=MMETSP1324-20130603/15741_1 /TAXON_ID=236786 /ORGANISM="Florenciella sp., Strain RCC1587" /LENGTH=421 /DNA_ID=CAMNT_0024786793 /DNA_START=157 /DNA_END=1422 /DNA_ORIENTATION=+